MASSHPCHLTRPRSHTQWHSGNDTDADREGPLPRSSSGARQHLFARGQYPVPVGNGRFCSAAASVVALGSFAALVLGCGYEPRSGSEGAAEFDTPASVAAPFAVHLPDGYSGLRAGRGTQKQLWGDDSWPTEEPFTVLAPNGSEPDFDDLTVVSTTGFAGYQGQLSQASAGAPNDLEELAVEVAGFEHQAYFAPPTTGSRLIVPRTSTDLVVERGPDLAVRITAIDREASLEELTEFVRATTPSDDHEVAPAVDPPPGWHVVGSANAGIVLSYSAWFNPIPTSGVPGLPSARSILWERGEHQLLVMALPSHYADLEAIEGLAGRPLSRLELSRFEVSGAEFVGLKDHDSCEANVCGPTDPTNLKAVFTNAKWGDLIAVSAFGPTIPTLEELAAIASSVELSDEATWEQFARSINDEPT